MLLIQVTSKFTLGRRFGVVAANRGRLYRRTLSLGTSSELHGYLLTSYRILLVESYRFEPRVICHTLCNQSPSVLAEERLLKQDPEYQSYCQVVRYRLIPGLF